MKTYLAELLGTFTLVFAGTGAIIINDVSGGRVSHFGIAATFGLVVMAMIYTLGNVSGAHLNPAVTVSLAAIGSFPWNQVPGYILAQIVGAFLGAVVVWVIYHPHFAETEDAGLKLAVFSTAPAIRPRHSRPTLRSGCRPAMEAARQRRTDSPNREAEQTTRAGRG